METLNPTNSPVSQPQAEEPSSQGGLLQSGLFLSASLLESSLPPLPFQLGVDTALPYRIEHGHVEHGQTEYGQARHRTGICRLRLFVPTRELVSARFPAVALVTEIPGQNGLSVTRGIEVIAAQVCRIHGLKPHNTILIEHYDDRENGSRARAAGRVNGEKFSCIVFEERHENAHLCAARAFLLQHPHWRPLDKEEVETLIGLPLP